MKPIAFPEQTLVLAKDQPEYQPLPAFQYAHDPTGRLVCLWQLTWLERLRLLWTGQLWHTIMTFRHPLQPQLLAVTKPFTPADHAASLAAQQQHAAEQDFTKSMLEKYGDLARKKTDHMNALNYHPNDRRRTIKFSPEDHARAQALGILHLHGCRIILEPPGRDGLLPSQNPSPKSS